MFYAFDRHAIPEPGSESHEAFMDSRIGMAKEGTNTVENNEIKTPPPRNEPKSEL